jgi:hypothetical protein
MPSPTLLGICSAWRQRRQLLVLRHRRRLYGLLSGEDEGPRRLFPRGLRCCCRSRRRRRFLLWLLSRGRGGRPRLSRPAAAAAMRRRPELSRPRGAASAAAAPAAGGRTGCRPP